MKVKTVNTKNTVSFLKTHKTFSSAVLRRLSTVAEQDIPLQSLHQGPDTTSTAVTKIPIHQIVSLLQTTSADEWLTHTDLRDVLSSSPSLSPYFLLKIARKLGSYEKSLQFFNFFKDNHAIYSSSAPTNPSSLSLIFQAVIEYASCEEEPDSVVKLRNLIKLARDQKVPLSAISAALLMKRFRQAEMHDASIAVFNELDQNLRNKRTGNLMLESLLKSGQVDSALKVLDEMFKSHSGYFPNKITMNIVLSASLARNGSGRRLTLKEILGIACRFMENEIFPDAILLTQLVTDFCRRGSTDDSWGLLHKVMRLNGQVDAAPCNALLTCLSKNNDFIRMNLLMNEMKEKDIHPNVITFGILINHLCKNRKMDDAMAVFRGMSGVKEGDQISLNPDVVIYNTLIDGLCKVGRQNEAMELMENMKTNEGCRPNTVTYNSLIDGFCKSGEIDSALKLFARMSKDGIVQNVITMNTILNGMCRCGKLSRAMEFFDEMQNKGLEGNAVTFTVLITAFCGANNIDKAMKLFNQVSENGVHMDAFVYYSLINGLSQAGEMDDASYMVSKLKESGFSLDLISYNCLISGFFRKNMFDKAVELFDEMQDAGMKPNHITYNTIISYFCSKEDMIQACSVIKMMRKDGIFPDVVTYGALIDAYCKLGDVNEAMKIFKDMRSSSSKVTANTVIYNILISSLCKIDRIEDAISLLDCMKNEGVKPNIVTYNALLKGFEEKGWYEKACEVMNQMNENGCNPDSATMKILTEWFSKIGKMDQVRHFLEGHKVSVSTL